jgi:hypothetical protein
MKGLLYILMFIINCTWGVIQSVFGLFLFLFFIKKPHFWYKGSIVTTNSVPKFIGGVSLGVFIFMTAETNDVKDENNINHQILRHEYGHYLQSLLLGPLFILLGPFSFFKKLLKTEFVEDWADKWGKADRRQKMT